MRTRSVPLALAVAAGALALAGTATAAQRSESPTGAAPAASAAPDAIPPGYTRVSSGQLSATAGTQTRGSASCPAGTVVLGGSVFVFSPSLLVNVNSSFPQLNGWAADVNNGSVANAPFEVIVICGTQPKRYAVVESNPVQNPSGTHTTAVASCPTGSRPLGGGGLSSSGNEFVNLNSTFPQRGGWRVDESNGSFDPDQVNAFAICGKLNGYVVVTPGIDLPTPADAQSDVTVTCPDTTLAISGGVRANSSSVAVTINATWIDGRNWNSLINNFTGVDFTARPFAVCAGT